MYFVQQVTFDNCDTCDVASLNATFWVKTPVNHAHITKAGTSGKLPVPRINNYHGDRTLREIIPYLFNSLPETITCENNKIKFKSM